MAYHIGVGITTLTDGDHNEGYLAKMLAHSAQSMNIAIAEILVGSGKNTQLVMTIEQPL